MFNSNFRQIVSFTQVQYAVFLINDFSIFSLEMKTCTPGKTQRGHHRNRDSRFERLPHFREGVSMGERRSAGSTTAELMIFLL